MAQFKVKLLRKSADGSTECDYLYVTAPDNKTGYEKARRKAEAKMVKAGKIGFRGVESYCVG